MIYRLEDVLKIIKGEFVCDVDGQKINDKDVDLNAYKNHIVSSMCIDGGIFVIELTPYEAKNTELDPNEDWVKEHKKQFGEEPSFF